MPERQPQFVELNRLLRQAGIMDRCSRRLIEELQDHYEDLRVEAIERGRDEAGASAAALREIGAPGDIAACAAQYRDLLCISRRYPLIGRMAGGLAFVPALPVAFCAQRRDSIARWGASVGLAAMLTAGLLLCMQTAVGAI